MEIFVATLILNIINKFGVRRPEMGVYAPAFIGRDRPHCIGIVRRGHKDVQDAVKGGKPAHMAPIGANAALRAFRVAEDRGAFNEIERGERNSNWRLHHVWRSGRHHWRGRCNGGLGFYFGGRTGGQHKQAGTGQKHGFHRFNLHQFYCFSIFTLIYSGKRNLNGGHRAAGEVGRRRPLTPDGVPAIFCA